MTAKKKVQMIGWNSKSGGSPLRGEGAFKPAKSKKDPDLQSRIDAVVEKAKSAEAGSGVDVIREIRLIRYRGLKAYRVG